MAFAIKRILLVLSTLFPIALGSLGGAQAIDSDEYRRYSVAVFDFEVVAREAAPPFYGRVMADDLGTALFDSGRFKLINRSEIDAVLNELGLSESGLVNNDQRKEFGAQAGVDLIVNGSVTILSPNLYRVTVKYTDVSTGESADQFALEAAGPEEFKEIAERFSERAKQRFPLLGKVVVIVDGGAWVDIGYKNGLREQDYGGSIYKLTEVAGAFVKVPVGDFIIKSGYEERSLITYQMHDGSELQLGYEVSIEENVAGADESPDGTASVESDARTAAVAGVVRVVTGAVAAEVFLDGSPVGSSPLFDFEVPAGTYRLRLEAEHHEPVEFSIDVVAGETLEVSKELLPLPAQVTLELAEATYEVFVDGQSRGQVSELSLAPGSYELDVAAPGKESESFALDLDPGESVQHSVELRWSPNVVVTAPDGTEVSLAPISGGTTTQLGSTTGSSSSYGVEPGNHRFILLAPNGAKYETEIRIASSEVSEITFPGYLTVEAPPRAEIIVQVGTEEVYRGVAPERLPVQEGTYRVSVAGGDRAESVSIAAAETVTLDLTPADPDPVARADEQKPNTENDTAERREEDDYGTLHISSNLPDATLILQSTESMTIPIKGSETVASVPPGLYFWEATGAGGRPLGDALVISAGETTVLELLFELAPSVFKIGPIDDRGIPRMLAQVQASPGHAYVLRLRGPDMWNDGELFETALDEATDFVWVSDLPLEEGTYRFTLIEPLPSAFAEVSGTLDVSGDVSVPSTDLAIRTSSSDVSATWDVDPTIVLYRASLFGSGAVLLQEQNFDRGVTEASKLHFAKSGLSPETTYELCVDAVNATARRGVVEFVEGTRTCTNLRTLKAESARENSESIIDPTKPCPDIFFDCDP